MLSPGQNPDVTLDHETGLACEYTVENDGGNPEIPDGDLAILPAAMNRA